MSTQIQWTDETWNPVTGCDKVSPGCAHCYAEGVAARFWPTQYPNVAPGPDATLDEIRHGRPRQFTDVMTHEDRLDQPLRWRKPRRVFVNSMSDLFHESVPDAFIDRVFAVMALAPQHTFQILTKRADRMRRYLNGELLVGDISGRSWRIHEAGHAMDVSIGDDVNFALPLSNVWLGPSIENQAMGDGRWPIVCELGESGWNVMVSLEPLLSSVTIPDRFLRLGPRAWVIVGGESGQDARPCAVEWIASIVSQCKATNVPVFVKQLGAYVASEERTAPLDHFSDPTSPALLLAPNGEAWAWRAGLRDRKGGDPEEWPDDLRVREFPEVR